MDTDETSIYFGEPRYWLEHALCPHPAPYKLRDPETYEPDLVSFDEALEVGYEQF